MLNRDFGFQDTRLAFNWDDLKEAAPSVMAIALVCSRAMVEATACELAQLSPEAQALLYAGRQRGVYEIKGDWEAFDSSDRMLAVSVEVEQQVYWLFKQTGQPEATMRFLAGFLELCRCGLVLHQWQREFVLSAAGFSMAKDVQYSSIETLLDFASKNDLGQWNVGD